MPRRILIIDDEENIRRMMRITLDIVGRTLLGSEQTEAVIRSLIKELGT